MKKIKLIWDFRGLNAEGLSKHHSQHINEYLENKKIKGAISSWDKLSEFYYIAYLIVPESDMIKFRDALMPHRAIYLP